MPKSKHRRKPGGKSVPHPGRVLSPRTQELIAQDERNHILMAEAYEHLSAGRLEPELIAEYKRLMAEEVNRWETLLIGQRGYGPPEPLAQSARLQELTEIIRTAIPDREVERYLIERHGYGTATRPLPEEFSWSWVS